MDNLSDKTLASFIVAHRHLGLMKDKAKEAMKILMKRKMQGSDFDYEQYIKEQLNNMHPTKIDQKQKNMLTNILQSGIDEFKNGK